MKKLFYILVFCTIVMPTMIWGAVSLQDNNTRNRQRPQGNAAANNNTAQNDSAAKVTPHAQIVIEEDTIPDSLLHPRWKIQRTQPITYDDLEQGTTDLQRPDNMKFDVAYNDTIDRYIIGTRLNNTWVNAPIMMSMKEYLKWSEKQMMSDYFHSKNAEIFQQKGKEKFDFSDMHFDLGPAEKIFGPGGVRIKTQGTAELKLGATIKSIDNPSLPLSKRNTTAIDFDEKINFNLTGKVGDKVNMSLNYNTDATFNFDSQNMKLKYDGKEDEIIKLVEAGNVSFPSNSSLINGASSLFGIRTDMQFGKLKLQTVFSQKKSNSKSVNTKGGKQYTTFEIDAANYEENRHFFMANYYRDIYDDAMAKLPTPTTGIHINRVEVWVTNKSGQANNTRNIIPLTDLGEGQPSNSMWQGAGRNALPSNNANNEYQTMVTTCNGARDISNTMTVLSGLGNGFVGGVDYEKLEKARLLNSSEYTVNNALGYISLKTTMQTDQILAIAYEYTYNGTTYQVGEFSGDITDVNQALFVKSLKNTNNNPRMGNWNLMMKNVYYLASQVEKDKFRLDIKFQSDTTGVYLSYIPEPKVKDNTLIKAMGADRLDNNGRPYPNGYFDFIEGYTVVNGRVFLPKAEPFGSHLRRYLSNPEFNLSAQQVEKYCYQELYDSTKTVAKQIAEKDKYMLQGQFRGSSANVISLGATDIPRGSVVVTAGGVVLNEGSDYSVDYSIGEVKILNQSIIDAGTAVNVSLESNTDYGQQRKTMYGINWEYDFTKDFNISGTLQHLSEQSLTSKVAMGSEPLSNTLWGFNVSWKKESQWLTNMLNKIPFLHVKAPSMIQLNAEFAQLISGMASGTQDNASYIDDFENTKTGFDVSSPTSWVLSSVPSQFSDSQFINDIKGGSHRARLAWYNIDPLFTRRSSSLTPGHIRADLEQLSNHYVREIPMRELYPYKDQSSYSGTSNILPILNLAYYPTERGPYNFSTELDANGNLTSPAHQSWGGMMRKLDISDFEQANIEYIEFWMLDPFIYTGTDKSYGGDLYFNLGEISEDILRDGKKFYESGMDINGNGTYTTSQWGKQPVENTTTYAFATSAGSRQRQDVGYNGLTDEEERGWEYYQPFLNEAQAKVSPETYQNILNDPANDNYHYFRGSDWDQQEASILQRYKYINNPQGNSPDSDSRPESYDTSYKTMPDVEDINQDYTLNEYEKYYQYRVSIRPEDIGSPGNYCVDKRETVASLRNGESPTVTWYQFRIPLNSKDRKVVGGISDMTSIRFIRMFMTNFEKPIVLRLATLKLVSGEWRIYNQHLNPSAPNTTQFSVSAVNIEENNDREPVNYVLPPGISRVVDPSQPQLTEDNEQAMCFTVSDMSANDAVGVYKNTMLDLRQYKHLQMFVHANALKMNKTNLQDDQLAVFIRLGSDYKSNYYEYEIPLKLTAPGKYSPYSGLHSEAVWPKDNMLNIDLTQLTNLKKQRNKAKEAKDPNNPVSYTTPFSIYDETKGVAKNKITVMGNPTLGEVKTMVIGVRNLSNDKKEGEVWVNELRLSDAINNGGWAAQGNLNVQLSDFGSINATGKYVSEGFGGLEEGVASRSTDNFLTYSITTNFEMGKFFPDKAKVQIPVYYSYTRERTSPKYNPLDNDMLLDDALESSNKHDRDSIESIAVLKSVSSNFSLSGIKVGIATKRHPMPYDPANFTFSYSHSHSHTDGETTVYENEDQWRGTFNYAWSPVFKPIEPFKSIKSKSKGYDILKRLALNWLPQAVGFNTEMTRNYHELQERDLEDLGSANSLPMTFSSQFLWNRDFNIRWDLTKNLHLNFQSSTRAEIEEPYVPVNKDLYPDQYLAWKDSVWTSIKNMGTPLDYNQTFTGSYQLPLNLIPIFDWVNSDASYNSTYHWNRGTKREDGSTLGNTITQNRTFNLNGSFNLEKLYDHIPFLKATNDRFRKAVKKVQKKPTPTKTQASKNTKKGEEGEEDAKGKKPDPKSKALPKNSKSFEREITIKADTSAVITHGRKSKRLIFVAKDENGKPLKLKYKVLDDNKIEVFNKTDSAVKVKVAVTAKEPLENNAFYRTAQSFARFLMMVRSVNFSYRNQYSMALPGFMPNVGNMFGENKVNGILSPGLDFAFGAISDDYVQKAHDRGWLNDSIASPATTNATEDLQLKMTLEPVRNFKIDLNASRTESKAKSIQYMYKGSPTAQSGSFSMTTISLKSAFNGSGKPEDGFYSKSFEEFCNSLEGFRQAVESRYEGSVYPYGTQFEGMKFSNQLLGPDGPNTGVNKYSADVMVPAFLKAYTGMNTMSIFPALTKLLPNWSIKYSGLSNITWFQNFFKSVNLNHSYKSIYAVGSYSSYSTYMEYMGYPGFITDNTSGTTLPIPNSMFNVSQVSINEAFSPLLGVDVTLHNNLTAKLEYRSTRVLNLSMTSVQINETTSNDWVIGLGYKINDFKLGGKSRKVKGASKGKGKDDEKKPATSTSNTRGGFNHDLNLRFDFSLRDQAAITRDIATQKSNASSGNKALKISFMADYAISKMLTMSFYYDRQTNTPLLSSNSYPSTTHDFGLSVKFSLTR